MGNLPTGFTNVLLIFIYFIFKKIKNYQFNYKLVLTNQKKSFIISSINNNIVYKKFSFGGKNGLQDKRMAQQYACYRRL
jgi:hypothetical protein